MSGEDPIRVLLVDDDPVTAAVIRGHLRAHDGRYLMAVVERYDQALERACEEEVDVVVVDDCLDHHHGPQLLAGLQQRGCRRPVVVLTHRRDRDFERLVRELGACEVLTRSELGAGSLDRVLRLVHRQRLDRERLDAWSRSADGLPDLLPGPGALLDRELRVERCNAALCELLGRAYGELVGRPVAELLAHGVRPGADPRGWNDLARASDGDQQVRCTLQHLPDGRHLLGLAADADSTRIFRKLTTDPDEASLLRNLVANLPDQIYLKDRRARFVLNNPRHLAVLGATDQAAALGRTDHDFFPADVADACLADDRLVIDNGEVILDKIEHLRFPDGNDRWISASKVPLRDERGRIIGLVGMSRDISDRMDDAEALAEQQRRIAALVSASPVVLFSLDPRGTITLSEGAGLVGLGLRAGETVGRSVFDLYTDVPAVAELCRRALAGERVAVDDIAVGARRFSARMEPVRDDLGQVREVIGVAYDITEEHAVRSRLRLRDSEFLQSQKMEAVGRLAGGVAHDFNNILTAILGHAELLRDRLEDERGRRGVERMIDVARKGAAMTRRLLAFCRRQAVEARALDLAAVVRSAVDLAQPLLGEGVTIQLALPERDLWILADGVQLEQVLLNLLVNARDAMDGQGRITIGASQEGGEVLVTVSDTGCGMDAATLARCREPFFTTKGEDKGTGLGLSTAVDIVANAGGRLEIASETGAGCTVFLTLPALDRPPERRRAIDSAADHPAVDLPARVVVVEDQADVRAMLGETLEHLGVQAVECHDGLAAWQLLDVDPAPCDLLVTDLHMPVMGGAELAQLVAARHPELPILFISGHLDEPAELPTGRRYRLLGKPFSRRRLVECLGELVQETGR